MNSRSSAGIHVGYVATPAAWWPGVSLDDLRQAITSLQALHPSAPPLRETEVNGQGTGVFVAHYRNIDFDVSMEITVTPSPRGGIDVQSRNRRAVSTEVMAQDGIRPRDMDHAVQELLEWQVAQQMSALQTAATEVRGQRAVLAL